MNLPLCIYAGERVGDEAILRAVLSEARIGSSNRRFRLACSSCAAQPPARRGPLSLGL